MRVRARLDRGQLVTAVRIGGELGKSEEVRIERRRIGVAGVPISPKGIGLPDLQENVCDRATVPVEHAPGKVQLLPVGNTGASGDSGEVAAAVGRRTPVETAV